MRFLHARGTLFLFVMGAAALGAPVWAQASEVDRVVLEEIIVTAQRREENLQTVPISVTTATAEFLNDNNIRTLEDLNGSIPGFFTTNSVAYNTAPVSIRGIGGSTGSAAFFSDAPVAAYVDGVYVARTTIPTTNLQDIDSIQVLRGPQGTLYGRNSTAGAVLLTTKRATEEFEAEIFGSYAEFDEVNVRGVISGPLTETLLARAVIGYSDKPGFGDSTTGAGNVNGSKDITARLSLSYDPSDTVTFDLIAEYYDREAQPGLIALSGLGLTDGATNPFAFRPDIDEVIDNNEFEVIVPNREDSKTYSVTLLGTWELDAMTVHSITGYRDLDFIGAQDTDNTELSLFENRAPIKSTQFSQELRLESNGSGRFSWSVGGFYFTEDLDVSARVRLFRNFGGVGVEANVASDQTTDAFAVFGDGTYELTDKLSLTLGARYSFEEKDFNTDRFDLAIFAGTIVAPPSFAGTFEPGDVSRDTPAFASKDDFSDFSPRAVLEYQASDDLFVYGSFSRGFKSGGFNTFGNDLAFGAESIDAFELGFKSELAENRVRLNGAIFYSDYSDLQIRTSDPGFAARIVNVGVAKIQGAEVELSVAVTEYLTISGNIAYLDAEITEGDIFGTPTNGEIRAAGARAPVSDRNLDVRGNKLPRSPEWQTYLNASYERPVGPIILGLSATYKYQDDVFYLETNQDSPIFVGEAWSEVDLRLEISDPNDKWQIAIYGQNVTDERRISFAAPFGGFPSGALSEPAKWGVETLIRF